MQRSMLPPSPRKPQGRHGGHGRVTLYVIMFCIMSSTLLVVNKAAVVHYPYPNTVLLLQLAASAAFAAVCGRLGWAEVDNITWDSIQASIPVSISFFLGVFTSINALRHVNVDTMIVLKTCTPIMVAVAEWMYMGYAMPSLQTWIALSSVVVATAASFSMHISTISTAGLAWVGAWFIVVVFNMVYSSYYAQTVKLTAMGRVLCENLIACVPAAIMVLLLELRWQLLVSLWSPGGCIVGLSCLVGFGMSWFGWVLRQEISALSYTVIGVLNKLVTVVINASLWERHGPASSGVLLCFGVCASALYKQPSKQQRSQRSQQQRAAGVLLGLAGILLLMRVGLQLGHVLQQSSKPGVLLVTQTVVTLRKQEQQLFHTLQAQRHQLHQQQLATRHDARQAPVLLEQQQQQQQQLVRLPSPGQQQQQAGLVVAAAGSGSQQLTPERRAAIEAAAQQPITVTLMTSTFFPSIGTGRTEPNCSYEGVPLDCRVYGNPSEQQIKAADAQYYHLPSFSGKVQPKAHPNQLRLAVGMEPAAYYQHMNSPSFMCQFDAEMTYRLCSQVVHFYSLHLFDKMRVPPVPFEQKEHALVYINSNCGAISGRSTIMQAMMKLSNPKVPVHSMGGCDRNKEMQPGETKLHAFSRYKFCVSMENSVNPDYVSEKVVDGLRAGCIPIYLGAPNIRQFLPVPWAVIMYGPGGNATTPEELDALMDRVGRDQQLYESLLAWKTMPTQQFQPVFRTMTSLAGQSGECRLCRFLLEHRMSPQPSYTTCVFNQTWMAEHKVAYEAAPAGCNAR